jgi:hypothetical protein
VSDEITPRDALNLYLAMLAGNPRDGDMLELRVKPLEGHIRRLGFFPSSGRPPIMAAVEREAERGDVYVGVAPRRKDRGGGIDAIEAVWCCWVDADTPEACAALRAFEPAPAILIGSGNGVHGYFPLRRPLTPDQAKRANRRLAHRLGADENSTDAARIMRPPGSFSWKSSPPKPVLCERLEVVSYMPAEVVGELPDPPAPRSVGPARSPSPVHTPGARDGHARTNLLGLSRIVRSAKQGNRNAVLFWACCRALEHVANGDLDEHRALDELSRAALDAGLDAAEIRATIRSGFAQLKREAA